MMSRHTHSGPLGLLVDHGPAASLVAKAGTSRFDVISVLITCFTCMQLPTTGLMQQEIWRLL